MYNIKVKKGIKMCLTNSFIEKRKKKTCLEASVLNIVLLAQYKGLLVMISEIITAYLF